MDYTKIRIQTCIGLPTKFYSIFEQFVVRKMFHLLRIAHPFLLLLYLWIGDKENLFVCKTQIPMALISDRLQNYLALS